MSNKFTRKESFDHWVILFLNLACTTKEATIVSCFFLVLLQELDGIGFEDSINLITQGIPVEYESVSSLIPDLWKKYKPKVIQKHMIMMYCIHRSSAVDTSGRG
jgi:hypothetical protein